MREILNSVHRDSLLISGGNPLSGSIQAPGAKNSVSKLLIASLLTKEPCRIENVPNIDEVRITIDLLESIGSKIYWDQRAKTIDIETKAILTTTIPQTFSKANRVPILLLGVLLGQVQEEITVPQAGGCKIGKRPVDFHLNALEALGATIFYQQGEDEGLGYYVGSAPRGLQGTEIRLPYPSLGASENVLLAACQAEGVSYIHNVSLEPEFLDLVFFLKKMGCGISFEADRLIKVSGKKRCKSTLHRVIPDRAAVASFALAALATKGSIFIEGISIEPILSLVQLLEETGAGISIEEKGVRFFYRGEIKGGVMVTTGPYPSFLTDMQQPLVAFLTQARGISVVHETVYEDRFGYTKTLNAMGADIQLFTDCLSQAPCRFHRQNYAHSLAVHGATPLKGQTIAIPDLRGGFAYLIAALIAEGETELHHIHFLKRGYENLVDQFQELGARIHPL